jgi:hypothetical protein
MAQADRVPTIIRAFASPMGGNAHSGELLSPVVRSIVDGALAILTETRSQLLPALQAAAKNDPDQDKHGVIRQTEFCIDDLINAVMNVAIEADNYLENHGRGAS